MMNDKSKLASNASYHEAYFPVYINHAFCWWLPFQKKSSIFIKPKHIFKLVHERWADTYSSTGAYSDRTPDWLVTSLLCNFKDTSTHTLTHISSIMNATYKVKGLCKAHHRNNILFYYGQYISLWVFCQIRKLRRMHREFRERFPRHRGLVIPTSITAHAWQSCRERCRDR